MCVYNGFSLVWYTGLEINALIDDELYEWYESSWFVCLNYIYGSSLFV